MGGGKRDGKRWKREDTAAVRGGHTGNCEAEAQTVRSSLRRGYVRQRGATDDDVELCVLGHAGF